MIYYCVYLRGMWRTGWGISTVSWILWRPTSCPSHGAPKGHILVSESNRGVWTVFILSDRRDCVRVSANGEARADCHCGSVRFGLVPTTTSRASPSGQKLNLSRCPAGINWKQPDCLDAAFAKWVRKINIISQKEKKNEKKRRKTAARFRVHEIYK